MDLSFSVEEEAFRAEVQEFLRENLPHALAEKSRRMLRLNRSDYQGWHDILHRKGWLAVGWPVEYGGIDWNPAQKHIFEFECGMAYAPRVVPFGLNMLASVLFRYGTQAQREYYLPRILDGSDWWCQGYSEPGAGSDLASLRMSALRQGDHYLVNGQKTWTTMAQYANKIFCLVRTSHEGKKQQGISFLLIDMDSPGVEVRPIRTLDGGYEINEVFFDDVLVPCQNLVGEENKGWDCAKYLLSHERVTIGNYGLTMAAFVSLRHIAQTQKRHGRPLTEDPLFAARMARLQIELSAMRTTNLRMIAAAEKQGAPGAESSLLKILGAEMRQEITDLARRAVGPYALPFIPEALEDGHNEEPIGPEDAAPLAATYFNFRKFSIFGGSNEIQKNIFAKVSLRL